MCRAIESLHRDLKTIQGSLMLTSTRASAPSRRLPTFTTQHGHLSIQEIGFAFKMGGEDGVNGIIRAQYRRGAPDFFLVCGE
jgi:hypothetical protein